MKPLLKRTTLNEVKAKLWYGLTACLLIPCVILNGQTDLPPEALHHHIADEAYAEPDDLLFAEDEWEPNLEIPSSSSHSGFSNAVDASPLIPWNPSITQTLIPIDHAANNTHEAAKPAPQQPLKEVEAQAATSWSKGNIALELPVLSKPILGERPGPSGVLPSEKAPLGSLPYNANTVVTPHSLIVQAGGADTLAGQLGNLEQNPQSILINFNNVGMIEFLRFVSRISNRNFIFNDQDLQFNVTIVSEDPTTIDNVMTALLQEVRIHQLFLIEQDNNFIIHSSSTVQGISQVVAEGLPISEQQRKAQIITQVFRLNTLAPERATAIIRPLLSEVALIESLEETGQLVVTDLAANIQKVGQLLKSLDSPLSGLVIGQYLVLNAFPDNLIPLAEKIMAPIAEGKPLVFVPHAQSNSIFIVSNPFLVERTIAVLSNLDINVGATRIFSPDSLRFVSPNNPFLMERAGQATQYGLPVPGEVHPGLAGLTGPIGLPISPGGAGMTAIYGPNGELLNPGYQGLPRYPQGATGMGPGQIQLGATGALPGLPGGAPGQIAPGTPGVPPGFPGQPYVPGRPISPGQRAFQKELPPGHIQRIQFSIYKLRYRKGQQIQTALTNISTSLGVSNTVNMDLVNTLNSVQYIDSTNSLVFSGTEETNARVLELIQQLDIPLRQVFIEVLILDASLDDSLTYGINFQARYHGANNAGAESFLTNTPLSGVLSAANVPATGIVSPPDASGLVTQSGFSLGLIGRTITKGGVDFASIGALVRAIHTRGTTNIIMNPKIIVEDNSTAEIFVGVNTSFQTSSIANDLGNIVTTNFDFRDVGTRLKVTPLLSSTDIITMDIEQTISNITTVQSQNTSLTNQSPGPTTSQNNTKTRVHVPDGYFLVISGMISDTEKRAKNQVPCVGGIPFIGGLFGQKDNSDSKRNVMIFLRPQIVDSEEEIDRLTKQQQDNWNQKNRTREMYKYEVDEALDHFNIKPLDCCVEDPLRNDYLH